MPTNESHVSRIHTYIYRVSEIQSIKEMKATGMSRQFARLTFRKQQILCSWNSAALRY
jgi:hypothetical protein